MVSDQTPFFIPFLEFSFHKSKLFLESGLFEAQHIREEKLFRFQIRAFQRAWNKASCKAGYDWARCHDMRHFFCSFLINHGVDHLPVAKLSGHKTLRVPKERYAHFENRTLKKAVSVFDNFDGQGDGFGKSLANL